MRFAEEIKSEKENALIYRFIGAGGKSAYVVWCSTSDDTHVSNITFTLPGNSATRIDFETGSVEGKATPIPVRQKQITLEAREKPVIILVPRAVL